MKTEIRVLSQHSRGSSAGFGGPDTYVAVIYCADDSVQFPKYLNRKLLEKRGIGFEWCGEGYHEHRGPKSALGKAIARAEAFIQTFGQEYEIALVLANGEFEIIDSVFAATDEEANKYAEQHHNEHEWYVLKNGINING